ncbi:protein of unknown function [Raineyella antarctica]|uniref:DUF1707 domain-containing protein n=1 Tax=Raineyella antarctica TaxID=1577474 RepID=A0A1G6HZA8_9ACTN|nr:DUF1707 domain-containing protein [Raineyella antarctica]SDB99530.1 protein of unknown function [Raineyella antarctica]
MSNLPVPYRYRSTPEKPVTDQEREELTARVNEAYTDGKLDDEQYRAHLDRVFAARTLGDLVPVVQVVGDAPSYREPAIVAQDGTAAPGELAEIKAPGRAGMVVLGVVGAGVALLLLLVVVMVALAPL